MSQDQKNQAPGKQINLDLVVMRKARQDREQASDLDDLVQYIVYLMAENKRLTAEIEALSKAP